MDNRVSQAAKAPLKKALRKVFEYGQIVGVDVLPRHFYSEIPDVRKLRHEDEWRRPHSLTGVAGIDVELQLRWLRDICPPSLSERLPYLELWERAARLNGQPGYGPIDADILFSFVHTRRPRRVVQIGAGASTSIALMAAEDAGVRLELTCVDPFPTDYLTHLADDGRITLRDVPVQALDPAELTSGLGVGDLFFIDSTHTVGPGSDVNHLILEVLPRLPRGVIVHFHDVTIPYEYSPTILDGDLFFWSESVLLQAYLADNPRYEVRLAAAMLHHQALSRTQEIIRYSNALRTERGLAVGKSEGTFPSSMWLEVVADPRRV